jgi:hypothetical protein
MGYYGSIEEDLSVFKKHEAVLAAPSERTKPSGIYVLYAHPELYTKAAELYTKAMPVKTTLFEELKLELWEYYEKGGKNTVTAEYYSDSSSLNRPWISRFKHFNLGVSHPDTFRCELHEVLDDFCIRDNVKNHEAEINEFQKLIAVFCSQRLIGRKIDVHQHYCFEQYPTFKWEEKWTHAVWKLAKESKK